MALNADQQAAVEHAGNLLILAPPGSGKTGTLIAKTNYVLSQSAASRVGLVTFTDKATQELKHRLGAILRPEDMRRIEVATFHKHCINLLRAAGQLGRLLGPQETPDLIQRAMERSGFIGDIMEATAEIEMAKLSLTFTGQESPLVQSYEAQRRGKRASDLWDVVRDCVLGIQAGTVPLLRVTHLLADEYQDTDELQQVWVLSHVHAGVVTTVVGDDDQSIYGFRRAMGYSGMMDFESRAAARRIVLQINYRSNAEILTVAQAIIRNNTRRVEKAMIAAKGNGGAVTLRPTASRATEGALIAKAIQDDIGEPDAAGRYVARPGRWAVIARNNASFRPLINELRAGGIVYTLSAKERMLDEIRILCQFLASLQSGDPFGIEALLGRRRLSDESLRALSQHYGEDLYRLLDGDLPPDITHLAPEDAEVVREVAKKGSVWRLYLRKGHYLQVIDEVALYFLNSATGLVIERNMEDFKHAVGILKRGRGSLVSRAARLLRDDRPSGEEGVSLLTMHAAKGLEFDRVFVMQVNAEVIPSAKGDASDVEEERRLLFVAVTRARHDLTITYQPASPGPSCFIREVEAGVAALAT